MTYRIQVNSKIAETKNQRKNIEDLKESLKGLKSPDDIEDERMKRAEEKAKKDPDSVKHAPASFFSRIVGSSHDGIIPDEPTETEKKQIKEWKNVSKDIHDEKEILVKVP